MACKRGKSIAKGPSIVWKQKISHMVSSIERLFLVGDTLGEKKQETFHQTESCIFHFMQLEIFQKSWLNEKKIPILIDALIELEIP